MKETIYKLPEQFLGKLKRIYPRKYPQICQTFLRKKLTTFRINYLKIDLPNLRKVLNREGIRYREFPYPKGSFILKSDLRKLQRSFIYHDGLIYVQNISSMIPPVLLDPKEGEKILDLCAAPGAKTTQIASLAGKNTEIVAMEKIRVRYYKLQANLKVQGADSVKAFFSDGVRARGKFPEYFDKILLDVPYSCEGLFYINNPHSYKYWKERKVKEMAHKQRRLMASAIHSLKEGGILIHSTCTFSPQENEEVINWALERFKGAVETVPLKVPLANVIPGLTKWGGKKFSPEVRLSLRIIPNDFMEAFFMAKLIKKNQ